MKPVHSRVFSLLIPYCSLLWLLFGIHGLAQSTRDDAFMEYIKQLVERIPDPRQGIYISPGDGDLREWSTILSLYRSNQVDSCKELLSRYNYSLIQFNDRVDGNRYDIFRENEPVRRGWGTFIVNQQFRKRIYIHVNHPVDDRNVPIVAADLFRKMGARWLMIGGSSRYTLMDKFASDAGRSRRTVFQRWHEILADLTNITLSVHGFKQASYSSPIDTTDIILSNGRTSDDQWGISQISLALRDTLRSLGLRTSLAMFDSGYAQLSGANNPQGVFANDSTGFGHWLNVELSTGVRFTPSLSNKFVAGVDRALDVTGKKVSQQVNRAFGLVSPRVIKLDSLHRILFPPSQADTYRIISFSANRMQGDTLNIRFGNWVEMGRERKTVASVTRLDAENEGIPGRLRKSASTLDPAGVETVFPGSSLHLNEKSSPQPSATVPASAGEGESDAIVMEPLQVHRIPLQPVIVTLAANAAPAAQPAFRWEGMVHEGFHPEIVTTTFQTGNRLQEEHNALPKFLIPLVSSSYHSAQGRFIGVQMTTMLIEEIARLVKESKVDSRDLGLLAEESEHGNYYLRVFPSDAMARNTVRY